MTKNNVTIAELMAELDRQLEWFESEDFVVEEAAQRFKEASQLAEEIERRLSEVKNEINVIKQSFAS